MIEDSQIWLIIGVTVGAVAVLLFISIIVNAYVTSRRLAGVLSDVEEMVHSDLKSLEDKIEVALAKIRAEAKANANRE
jgi:hypothetical protein